MYLLFRFICFALVTVILWIQLLRVALHRWKRVRDCDIARVKSFFTAQTFNFSSRPMPGVFHSQRDSISQSAKHYFRLPESRFMLKLKSYSFPSERIAPVLWILCISRNDDNRRRFYFPSVYAYIYTPTSQPPIAFARSRRKIRPLRRRRARGPDRVKCFPAAVEWPRACKSDAAARRCDMQHGTKRARVRSRVPSVLPVSTPSGIVHRASAARVHYQRPSSKSFTRYSHTHHAFAYRLSIIAYVRIASITIDEIISAASNRVIGTFRAREMYFAQRRRAFLYFYMYFSRFENDWSSDKSYRVRVYATIKFALW